MKLIIAEKPELGRAIATAICKTPIYEKDGSIECGEYTVISAFGHLFKLKQPEDYDVSYKKWSMDVLPIYFKKWEIIPYENKIDRINTIERLLKKSQLVVHAGDPDDEGQLLIDEILDYFDYKGPVKRLLTNDNNPVFIQNKMKQLEDNNIYRPNGDSARARSVADFMVGINYTRFFTLSNTTRSLLNIGRVQTPTLGLVVLRDLQIENHKKSLYYELDVLFSDKLNGIKGRFYPSPTSPQLNERKRVTDKSYLINTLNNLKNKNVKVKISRKEVVSKPPLPLNQVELQTWCGKKYGYTLDETSKAAQSLREKYKAITYNRSSSRNLNLEHFTDAPRVISAVLGITKADYPDMDLNIKSSCFKAVKEPHHAIIPTGAKFNIDSLTQIERDVFNSIALFYCLQFTPNAIDYETTLYTEFENGDCIKTISLFSKEQGWRAYTGEKHTQKSILDEILPQEINSTIIDGVISEIETSPPPPYTEISLNKDMTCISKYVKDEKIKEILLRKDKDSEKDKGSIGTESTRTAIITNLIKNGFLKLKGKNLISTQKGRELYSVLPDEIKLPDMTAKWWAIQEKIKNNTATQEDLYTDVLQTINLLISRQYNISIGTSKFGKTKAVIGKCPRCGSPVYEGEKSFYCSGYVHNPKCNFAIWKENLLIKAGGKEITTAIAKSLLTKGTAELKGLLSQKTGNPFDATLVLMDNGEKTTYIYEFAKINRKK